ncbi:MAG: hypothetical protein HRT43_14385 [Campylobacteraceae bacterium]|nr:hypothetical protein [Campylobacteraceae bacterium]
MSEVKSVEQVEVNELSESNAELAAFLGEDTSNLPVVIETIDTEIIEDHKMDAIRPDKLTEEAFNEITSSVSSFIEKVKEDATDMTLSSLVYKIGEKAANMAMPHVSLYDNLIVNIMDDNQKGPEVKGTKDYNILRLKRELDLINPAVLAKTPIKQKFLMFLSKTELPGSEKIMDMIYERKETVKSSTDGIKVALLQNANYLDKQLADLMMIYKGLLSSHLVLKGEIYQAQLIYNEITDLIVNITDSIEKQNIETVLADLTTQINALIVEENMNAQFFAGSQLTAKLVREQQNQIRILVRQMEKAVLANLGLRVVAKGLENSVNQSKALGDAIANTIADTAKSNEKTAEKLIKARTEGYIDLSKLQEGVESLERTFEKEAKANELIIKQGLVIAKSVRATTQRLEKRVHINLQSEKS